MKNRLFLFLLFSCLLFTQSIFAQQHPLADTNRGVWVSVFSGNKVLYSKAAVDQLIKTCKDTGINQIYLQVYQSGKAFYNSKICDQSKYKDILSSAQGDTIDYILQEALKSNIKVFAWVNLLSLGQNDSAEIINKFGSDVLTLDQYSRPSGNKLKNESDKYYFREEQLFLEPGDQRVVNYLNSIVSEIITRYPSFSGVHLDYVRYPMTVPFTPGSRFTKLGLHYGYGKENVLRFKEWTGIDPVTGLNKDQYFLLWDNWRRKQVTDLVRTLAKSVKQKSSGMLVSSAVIPSSERAYASMFQDWPSWLEEGILDYVVLMNYTLDNQLTKEIVRSSLCLRQRGKIFAGVGLFLMKDEPLAFEEQYKIINDLNPDGVVFFSYDDITPEIIKYLREH